MRGCVIRITSICVRPRHRSDGVGLTDRTSRVARRRHMGITKKQMEALARKHGVRGARDLVDRRRELPISDVLRRKLELAPCGSDAYPNSHIPMDVQETKQIHGILESAARFIGLHMTVVGSGAETKCRGAS